MGEIKVCQILGANINILSMQDLIEYLESNLDELRGKYICVSNVHTTVMAYEDEVYRNIQNSAAIRIPDGKPLSVVAKRRGFTQAERVTGPDLMEQLFALSSKNKYRHFFYGSTDETLEKLKQNLTERYPDICIAGMYSPPFKDIGPEEDGENINMINQSNPDIVWVGLGAPKQERYMYEHMNKINGIMIGVGAGFDYCAKNIKRAPLWMQKMSLEWLYRLFQDPKRLYKRYKDTNIKFIKYIRMENKTINGK